MIIIERTITIRNDQATLDNPIYLYRGDGDIVYLFTIKEITKAATFGKIEANNPVSQASYGNVRIYKPDGSKCVFTEKSEVIDDKLQVVFSYENIDQFTEVGIHKLQIHLYDDNEPHNESNDKNRFTLPPIDINVLLPIGDDNAQVDEAVVGYSLLDAIDEEVPAFDDNGNYNMTVWQKGDIITQDKLNKLEEALHQVTAADDEFITNEVLETELANKADVTHKHNATTDIEGLHRVAITGLYNDLNGRPNLSAYATKSELSNKANNNHTHSGYASSNHTHSDYANRDELANKSNVGHGHSEYALKADVPTVPTRLGQLTNDRGYITSSEIPANYVTESELTTYNYITKSYADSNFASTDYVKAAINQAIFPEGDSSGIDLSAYALKSEVPSRTSQLTNNSGFITNDALAGYATTTYVSNTIDERLENFDDFNLSNYPTNDDMNSALANKANVEHNHGQYSLSDHTHEDYALKSDIPDLVEVPTNVGAFTNDIGYVTNTDVDNAINNAITPINETIDGVNEDLETNYAKKTDLPTIPTNVSAFENDKDYIASSGIEKITRIEIVTILPETEEEGVLYIVKE